MDDLTITRLCAEAMGWEVKPAAHWPNRPFRVYQDDAPIYGIGDGWITSKWNPLQDDAQAMALVKKFQLDITPPPATASRHWIVRYGDADLSIGKSDNLNRAICECVAKMRSNESHNGGAEK